MVNGKVRTKQARSWFAALVSSGAYLGNFVAPVHLDHPQPERSRALGVLIQCWGAGATRMLEGIRVHCCRTYVSRAEGIHHSMAGWQQQARTIIQRSRRPARYICCSDCQTARAETGDHGGYPARSFHGILCHRGRQSPATIIYSDLLHALVSYCLALLWADLLLQQVQTSMLQPTTNVSGCTRPHSWLSV